MNVAVVHSFEELQMTNDQDISELVEWHFNFGLSTPDSSLIPESKCDELLDLIIDWAEQHGYGVGGGYRPFTDSDE
jgi:hypothetical protein